MQSRFLPVLALTTWAGTALAQGVDGVGRDVRVQRPQTTPMVRDEVPAGTTAREHSLGAPKALDAMTPIHTAAADPLGGAYGVWAAGHKYKVGFAGDMTFVPYLGSQYPHNQPFSWRTSSVRMGGNELLVAGEVPIREHDAYQYRYRYGSVTEVYDVRAEGMEQSFVLTRRPAVQGNLVIEGTVNTGLRAEAVANAHQDVRFFDSEGRLILTYGKAFAIDALGNKTNVTTMVDGNLVRLQLDAAWLEQARYPVTVDPIVTPTILTWGSLRESVDVCRDDSANQRMLAFIRTASATDKDVYAYIVADDYGTTNTVFSDVTTSWSHDQIRCATAFSPQKYGVIHDRLFPSGYSAIRFHVHDSGDLVLSSNVFYLSWSSAAQDSRPDIGGTTASVSGSKFMVAFQRDAGATLVNTNNSEIWCVTLDVSGAAPVEGTPFQLARWNSNAGDHDMERPAINKQATATATTIWMVVWQEYWNNRPTPPDDWDTAGRLVNSAGSASASAWATTNENAQNNHQLGPVVAGSSGRYCVSYAFGDLTLIGFKTLLTNGTAVVTERVNWSSLAVAPSHFPEHILWGPHADRRWRVGDIGYDNNTDSHFAVSSVSDRAYVAAATGNVYIDRVGYRGFPLEYATLYGAALGAPAGFSGEPGGVCFDDDNDEMAVVWAQNDLAAAATTLGTAHEVYTNSYSYDVPVATSLFGVACTPALISWRGYNGQQIGHEFTGVQVTGAPAGSLHFVAVSYGTANVPVINASVWPGCRLLINNLAPNFIGIMPMQIGANVIAPLSLPEFLGASTIHFQDWLLDPATMFFYSTQRLTVPITR